MRSRVTITTTRRGRSLWSGGGRRWIALAVTVALLAGSCGSDDVSASSGDTATSIPDDGAQPAETAEADVNQIELEPLPTDGADIPAASVSTYSADPDCVAAAVGDDEAAAAAVRDDVALETLPPEVLGPVSAAAIECGATPTEVLFGPVQDDATDVFADCLVEESGDDLPLVLSGLRAMGNPPGPEEYRDRLVTVLVACTNATTPATLPDDPDERLTYLSGSCGTTLDTDMLEFLADANYSLAPDASADEIEAVATRHGVDANKAMAASLACSTLLPMSVSLTQDALGEPLSTETYECLLGLDPVELGVEDATVNETIAACMTPAEADAFDSAVNE